MVNKRMNGMSGMNREPRELGGLGVLALSLAVTAGGCFDPAPSDDDSSAGSTSGTPVCGSTASST